MRKVKVAEVRRMSVGMARGQRIRVIPIGEIASPSSHGAIPRPRSWFEAKRGKSSCGA